MNNYKLLACSCDVVAALSSAPDLREPRVTECCGSSVDTCHSNTRTLLSPCQQPFTSSHYGLDKYDKRQVLSIENPLWTFATLGLRAQLTHQCRNSNRVQCRNMYSNLLRIHPFQQLYPNRRFFYIGSV